MKKRTNRSETFSLIPKNNFIIGIGSVLNIVGSYFTYNYSKTDEEADYKALTSDWRSVGSDIRSANKKLKKSRQTNY